MTILFFDTETTGVPRSYTAPMKDVDNWIHRIVAKAFIINPKNKPCVNHKNGIKTDNRVENLEWATYSENEKHAHINGLKKATIHSKINKDQVTEIRISFKEGKYNPTQLSKLYGLTRSNIYSILNNKTWK